MYSEIRIFGAWVSSPRLHSDYPHNNVAYRNDEFIGSLYGKCVSTVVAIVSVVGFVVEEHKRKPLEEITWVGTTDLLTL